jgi:hypothetical protein
MSITMARPTPSSKCARALKEACLFLTLQHLDLEEAGLAAHELQKREAVGGVAHRARGHRLHARSASCLASIAMRVSASSA